MEMENSAVGNFFAVTATPASQIQALELLFNSTQGDQWRWKNEAIYGPKWSFSSPQADPCNDQSRVWQGITCSSSPNICMIQSCEIVSLSLNGYNLQGTLPAQFFVPLTSLVRLEITASLGLVGSIPTEICSLFQLNSLSLQINRLTGTIPSGIGSISKLDALLLYNNRLTGPIPTEISSFSRLKKFVVDKNELTGTIPSQICSLLFLNSLSLYDNQLTGTIHSGIGSLSKLTSFYLYNNQLTGTIPSEIASLVFLDSIPLSDNRLTGSIPSEIGSLAQLVFFSLRGNQVSGTIPPSIGSLVQLGSLFLDNNQLTGTIPSGIGSLIQLDSLSLYNNQLTGSIPSEIGSLSNLDSFYLHENRLTGTIPAEITSLSQLSSFYLSNNQLTGTIPASFSNLLKLVRLHLYDNRLSGVIAFELASFPQLQQLFIHQNHFTGHLNSLVSSSSSWNASSSELLNLDVSDNLFSGSIPSTLFLPNLQSISLSLNCFEHELPSSICDASDAGVISMDGLGSAKGCKKVTTVPFTDVDLVRSLEGNIPNCIWSLSNLRMLNLAGNGLRGRIGTSSSMPSLLSLTLSHNYLSGEIPLWLQKMNLSHLDLSYNKLTGDANGFRHQNGFIFSEIVNRSLGSRYFTRSLALSVNRLSGDLPNSFGSYKDLDILSGNLFGCAHLPNNDENSDYVSCGSQEYDQTMVLMGAMVGLIVCLATVFYFVRRWFESKDPDRAEKKRMDDRSKLTGGPFGFLSCISVKDNLYPFSSINSFESLLARLMWSVCVLGCLCLVLSLPIYVLKQRDVGSGNDGEGDIQYVTHSYMYSWLWTMAFLSGTTPAILLLVMCFFCLFYFTFVMNRLGGVSFDLRAVKSPPSSLPTSNATKEQHHFLRLTVWIIFILNVVIVGSVNGLYLWSTLRDLSSGIRIWIQFSIGFFSFLWSVALRYGLPSKIKESKYGLWLFTCLNVMNSVLIPCVVTSLSSPSCYQVSHSPNFLILLLIFFL
jgi:Leucine-rich repeat (LRR) protein